MGNPNMKSIDDKKVVQSPCRKEKKGNNFLGENQPGIPGEKKYPREKNPRAHRGHNTLSRPTTKRDNQKHTQRT